MFSLEDNTSTLERKYLHHHLHALKNYKSFSFKDTNNKNRFVDINQKTKMLALSDV